MEITTLNLITSKYGSYWKHLGFFFNFLLTSIPVSLTE